MSPRLYQPDLVEGVDYVRCYECLQHGWDFRFLRMASHIHVHGLTEEAYLERHPGKPLRLAITAERRKATVQARFGVDNVFQAGDIKEKARQSLQEHYGVASPIQSEELRQKMAKTNLARYGVENPFSSKEVQTRIQKTVKQRYGVPYPNQSSQVRAKTRRTSLERYGVDTYLRTDDFKEKFRATSMKNFGVPHPMSSEEGQKRWHTGCEETWGVPNPLLVPTIHQKSQDTTRSRHGGRHHLADPAFIEKRKKHLLELYGVDNVSKIPAIKDKIIRILKARWESGAVPKMNNLERAVSELFPERIVYSGDWSYWVTWANGKHKNPDFVVLTPEQLTAYKSGVPLNDLRTHLVIEINGDFWHTKHKGLTRASREREFVGGYASVGVSCLVIWEGDFRSDPASVSPRVATFLSGRSPKPPEPAS